MHFSVSVFDPLQSRPPLLGFGESHLLVLILVPLSQFLEHRLHEFQLPQNPSTGSTVVKSSSYSFCERLVGSSTMTRDAGLKRLS